MNPSPFRDLDRILRILKEMRLPHARIGGWAIISWGVIRASEDLDMLIDLSVSRRRKLLAALAVDYEAEWREGGENALEISTNGITIPVVRPEELMAMKLEAGGGQDYEDVLLRGK